MGFMLTVPNRRFRAHGLTSFRMCKFPNLLWGPRFGGWRGGRHVSPELGLDFHVMSSLFPTIVGAASHFICTSDSLASTLARLWYRPRCWAESFHAGEKSSMVEVGTNREPCQLELGLHHYRLEVTRNCTNKSRLVAPF